jgi:SAM-dependent methyltransferase
MSARSDAAKNRRYWDRESDEYQRRHGEHLRSGAAWGVWQIPEDDLRVLGSVRGKDVLELGCGGAQWSVALAGRGARPVGLDNSRRQLQHARANMRAAELDFPLVHAGAEVVPLPDRAFDIVFCDHGAMSFADPRLSVPEVARLLRPGGLLAFNMSTPLRDICWNDRAERVDSRLHEDYFGLRRFEDDAHVEFQLAYGEWIRLFRANGLAVEDLIELRAPEDGVTTYDYISRRWARRWPAEHIWKVRRGTRGGRSR